MVNNRKFYGPMLPGVDHLRHTLDLSRNAFSAGCRSTASNWRGPRAPGAVARRIHDRRRDRRTISGSAGVVLPPEGYLKRIREICDKHGILLIFDEVITGFGRVGKAFAAQRFGVTRT